MGYCLRIVRYCVRILRYRTSIMMLRLAILAAIAVIVLSGPSGNTNCKDKAKLSMCKWQKEKGNCPLSWNRTNCAKTCGYCRDSEERGASIFTHTTCYDTTDTKFCN